MKSKNIPFSPALIVLVSIAFAGCQTTQVVVQKGPISESTRAQMGRVAVEWESNSNYQVSGITPNKFAGAGKGSMNGALGGAYVAMEGGPLGLLLLPVFAAAGAGVGAVAGAVVADDASSTKEYIRTIDEVMREINREMEPCMEMEFSKLEDWSFALSRSHSGTSEEGDFQSRLVLRYGRVQASNASQNNPRTTLSFSLRTDAELYLKGDDYPIEKRVFVVCTAMRPLSTWAADEGHLLKSELINLARATTNRAIDDFFREGSIHAVPVFPQPRGIWGPKRIETMEPVFQWTLEDGGQEIEPTIASTITYQLLIIDSKGNRQEFKDLDTNSIKVALEPNATYRWRVRAIYRVRDQERATPWTPEQFFRSPKG